MIDFHFLRPLWLVMLIPLCILVGLLLNRPTATQVWENVCDKHLLSQLLYLPGENKKRVALALLALSAFFMIFSLSGPAWKRLPVPIYKPIIPRIIVLDLSESMLANDLAPNRLERAKFKLHDIFTQKAPGQFALIVYSGEPYVVSPLTEDGQTIDALLSALTPEVMPVEGQKLEHALEEGSKLLQQAGFHHGDILVMTATAPSAEAIAVSETLAQKGINTSIIPLTKEESVSQFKELAEAGEGKFIPFSEDSSDIEEWLKKSITNNYKESSQSEIPIWQDEGRWFLVPALLLLLPVFRRGWLQKVQQ